MTLMALKENSSGCKLSFAGVAIWDIVVVLLVMRHNLLRPIRELLTGARAIGQGDLAYRVVAPRSGNEIAQLASEFNRMAESLAEQRLAAERQAEERLALERELRHSERLASVGRLATGVAHEMGVSDTGSGIPPENLTHIFDPLFTTKEVGQGTGLGLSVARRIVEEHDGWIEAANRAEGGAAFTVWLPKIDAAQS